MELSRKIKSEIATINVGSLKSKEYTDGLITLTSEEFEDILSILEEDERYEDCQVFVDNRETIISNQYYS